MICTECVYDDDCSMKSACVDRCIVYLKNKEVQLDDNILLSLIDTFQISYDDLNDLLECFDNDC